MTYSDITFNDKNPIKRYFQQRRLTEATSIAGESFNPKCVVDFGAGNGELCKHIALIFPKAKVICYEPTPSLMAEAKQNLVNLPQIVFCHDIAEIASSSVQLIFCLEVFEHLPKDQTLDVLGQFNRILSGNGKAVIGVPIEIGIPALYKGIFRMSRRFGSYDASIKNVLLSLLRFPPKNRPLSEITPGFTYYYEHMGFDYRNLQSQLRAHFSLEKVITSPFYFLGQLLNPEVNFLVKKNRN
jgi:SAM-dependent methyltransferase